MTDSLYLSTIQIWQNLTEHYSYLTSTKSVIWKINLSCSPFQLLNMLPFDIWPEQVKLIYYSITVLQYYFKTDTICLLFLSSHVFTTLEFDSNYSGILLWRRNFQHRGKFCNHLSNPESINGQWKKITPCTKMRILLLILWTGFNNLKIYVQKFCDHQTDQNNVSFIFQKGTWNNDQCISNVLPIFYPCIIKLICQVCNIINIALIPKCSN